MSKVQRFVKRAAALPGFPALPVSAAAAVVLATLVGAFGTGQMPFAQRLAFWAALIGLNAVLWQLWFVVWVRENRGWSRAAWIGAIVLNLPLPFEIALLLRAFGVNSSVRPIDGWAKALAISTVIMVVAMVVRRRRAPTSMPHAIKPYGLLARAGAASPGAVLAIRSEDHYCRVSLADGRTPLIHFRFGDALDEVAHCDGFQVHRSWWVASAGVIGAVRNGRAWRLILSDDSAVPVSARNVPEARSRGWLARSGLTR